MPTRRRSRLVAGLVVAVVALVGAVAAGRSSASTVAPVASGSRCPVAAPTTAAGYQAMFDAKNDAGWSGADQATSYPLPDHRVLWLFGDTVQGAQAPTGGYVPGARVVHSSFLLQDRGCLTAVNGPAGREVVPNAPDGDFYWPTTAVVDAGRLLVFVARTHRTGPGAMDFVGRGTEIARFRLVAGGPPVFEGMSPTPSTGTPETAPQYGQALLPSGGFVYVYASRKQPGAYVFGKAVTVARVPAGHVRELSAWRYWDGRTWSPSKTAAVDVVSAAPAGWSTSFSVFPGPHGTVRYVTKELDFLGKDVITGTAPSPVGPFTRTVVAAAPTTAALSTYNALAHPEATLAGGALLVTVCRNTTDLGAVSRDADLYKPQFLAAP